MLCYLNHRCVISLSGIDRSSFIQGLITQDIHLLKEIPLLYSWLLSAIGRYQFDLFIFEKENTLYIDTDRADDLIKKIKPYILKKDVHIVKTDFFVYAQWLSDRLSFENCYKDPRHLDAGHRIYSMSPLECDATIEDYDIFRAKFILPDGKKDLIIDKSLLMEWNMDSAVSFTKGCYMGQELTTRTKFQNLIKKKIDVCLKDAKHDHLDIVKEYGSYIWFWKTCQN